MKKTAKPKSPPPSAKGRRAKKGRIARSQELVQWASIFIGMSMLQRTVSSGVKFLNDEMNQAQALMSKPDQHTALLFMTSSVEKSFMIVLPLTLLFMALSVVGHFAQVRFVLSSSRSSRLSRRSIR